MLNRQAILDTLLAGCESGLLVMRCTRPDRSQKTFWHEKPDEVAVKDPSLEVVLPEAATLTEIPAFLLAPGKLPGLWSDPKGSITVGITVKRVYDYFAGGRTVSVPREGYEDVYAIPAASREVIDPAIHAAVKTGILWLRGAGGAASILEEDVPAGILSEEALLQAPPEPIPPTAILPDTLPDAWPDKAGPTSALAIHTAACAAAEAILPWVTVRNAIDGALKTQLLKLGDRSAPWPCDVAGAKDVLLQVPVGVVPVRDWPRVAEAILSGYDIQDLADQVPELTKLAGHLLSYRVRVELAETTDEVVAKVREILLKVSEELKLSSSR